MQGGETGTETMAFSGSDANLVWQQVKNTLVNGHPVAAGAFDALRRYLATQGGNPQLQILPFSEADADAAGGTVLLSGACKVYGVYVKKLNSGTDNTVKLFDDATDDTTSTDQRISLILEAANQYGFIIYPAGFALATGIVVTQHTTIEGSSDGSDGGDGFVLIGAA
jgi:hypothetical protein